MWDPDQASSRIALYDTCEGRLRSSPVAKLATLQPMTQNREYVNWKWLVPVAAPVAKIIGLNPEDKSL